MIHEQLAVVFRRKGVLCRLNCLESLIVLGIVELDAQSVNEDVNKDGRGDDL